jgi:uncharacterized protein
VDVRGLTGFAARWSALHGGVPATPVVLRWLRLVRPVAAALAARGVRPLALTVAGAVAGWLAVWPAAAGWPAVAAAFVLAGAGCDALDGAVAVLAGTDSAAGALADAVADRVAEAGWGAALWLAGVPGWLATAAVAVGWLQEYLRERAGRGPLAVTVAERPTRVLLACAGLVAAAWSPTWAAAAVAGWLAAGAAGAAQLVAAARRSLAEMSDPVPSLGPMTPSIPARISIITLGVRDLAASVRFYQALGWRRSSASNEEITWFVTADSALGLFPHGALAEDAQVPAGEPGGFRGVTLAVCLGSPAEVDEAMAAAAAAGARVVKRPEKVFWGGYSGYFADPDGHLWELAHNPSFAFTPQGQLDLP